MPAPSPSRRSFLRSALLMPASAPELLRAANAAAAPPPNTRLTVPKE